MNLLLSTAYGPDVTSSPLYLLTIRSWAETCSHTTSMLWIVKDVPESFIQLAHYYGVKTAEASGGDWMEGNAGERYRHWAYAQMLQKLPNVDWVMTFDARDTIFHRDPFDGPWMQEHRVSVSQECTTVKDCPWNFDECQSLAGSLREEAPPLNGHWPVINGGFAVGRPDQMVLFELARMAIDVKIPVHSDQASITYLANVSGVLNVVQPEEPWVCHGHWHDGRPYEDYALFHQHNRVRVPEDVRVGILKRWLPECRIESEAA